MPLQIGADKGRDLGSVALEAPASHGAGKSVLAANFVLAGAVEIKASCSQKLQRKALALDSAWGPQQPLVDVAAVAPKIDTAEHQKMGERPVAAGQRVGRRTISTKTDLRRQQANGEYATNATHGRPPEARRLLAMVEIEPQP